MLPALHAKAPVRGLGWVHRGVQARAVSAIAAAAPQVHELAPDVEALIRSVHANKTKAVVYVTGGAVQASALPHTRTKACASTQRYIHRDFCVGV